MERKGIYKIGKFPQKQVEYFDSAKGLASDKALCLAATKDGTVLIGTDCGLNYLKEDGSFGFFACESVTVLHSFGDTAFFATGKTVYSFKKGKIRELQQFEDTVTGISGDERIFLVTQTEIFEWNGKAFDRFHDTEMSPRGLSVTGGKIVSFSERSLMVFAGKRKHWMCIFPEHSTMPAFQINSVTFDSKLGFVWLGTDKGVFIYDNADKWFGHNEISCLPEEATYNIRFAEGGRTVISTEAGLVILENGSSKYLPADRYVCDEKVNDAIQVGESIWTATDKGVTKIIEKMMTLEEKAKACFDLAEKYYVRHNGYVVGVHNIEGRDIATGVPSCSDNDGLWTHTYLAGLCYQYAVTKDKKVLECARRSMNACALLTQITGIKGFTARAVRYEGDPGYGKNLDMQIDGGEWHKAPDGKTEWLGETSSDEMTGHFFGFSLYYDLCADKKEKEQIKTILCDIVDHILQNNYRLCDYDGLPTTWACWTPSELNRNSMWNWERCINSLEMLTFLSVAYHVSGDEKYRNEYIKLATSEHYLLNAAQHKKDDGRVTHIDDNLGFLCSATIFRLEKDPQIRAYLFMGLKHHWAYERSEHCVLFNFIYGAFTDAPCDIDIAVQMLRDMPLDFINYRFNNSKRKNLAYDEEPLKWGGELQLKEALAVDERTPMNYDSNPYRFVGGRERNATNPSCYILPYWFGRYYGLIEE